VTEEFLKTLDVFRVLSAPLCSDDCMSSFQAARLMSLWMPARRQLGLTSKLSTSTEGQETMQKYTATQQRSTRSSTGRLNTRTSSRACQLHGGGKSRIHMAMGQTKCSLLINNFTESLIHIDSLVSGIRSCCNTLLKITHCCILLTLFLFFSFFKGWFFG